MKRKRITRSRTIGLGAAAVLMFVIGGMLNPAKAQFTGPALTLPDRPSEPLIPTTDPALLNPSQGEVRIGAGDLLGVSLFGVAAFAPPARVSIDGTIQLPLVGMIKVSGLTTHETETLLADRLKSAGIYKDPQVSIQLAESVNQYAVITGEIHGAVPILGPRHLLEVLATAGGTATANSSSAISTQAAGPNFPLTASHMITIIRQGLAKPIIVNLGTDPARSAEANIAILPHDLIIVSRVGVVYVVGAFNKQGAIALDQSTPLTLLQATTLSGGLGFEGRYEDLRIIRTVGLERKVVSVDVKKVMQGKNPDPILQADDIIFLPTNLLRASIKSGGVNTVTSIASLAIIALTQLR